MENEEILINEDTEPTPEGVNEIGSFDDNTTPPAVIEPFVIPNIYNYDGITKEFTGLIEQADKDSAKSAQVGHFVPMVHANATLLEPPTVEENQIQVYSKTIETHEEPYEVIDEDGEKHIECKTVTEVIESWNIEPDYRKNFYKVDNDLNVFNITTIGEQEGYIIVDKATGEDIEANKDWYKIINNEVIKKSEEEYEQEQAERREAEFNKAFFNTSLGYIRRKVTMKDGSKKDFLSDLVLSIKAGLEQGLDVKILTYDKPPFDRDIEDWTVYQHVVSATPQFIIECLMQTANDFLPINED